MSRRLDDIQEQALKAVKLTEDEFKGCMVKFGNERKIVELIMESQARQEEYARAQRERSAVEARMIARGRFGHARHALTHRPAVAPGPAGRRRPRARLWACPTIRC